jgi:signal transduction histidine kinase
MHVNYPAQFNDKSSGLASVINAAGVGIWELEIQDSVMNWSAGLYHLLGYQPDEINPCYESFIDNLVYHKDKRALLDTLNHPDGSPIEIRLLTSSGYRWFRSTVKQSGTDRLVGTLVDINQYKLAELKATEAFNTHHLAKLSSWEIDLLSGVFSLNNEGYDILGLTEPIKLSLEEFIDFCEPEHREILSLAVEACKTTSRPFDIDVSLRNLQDTLVWVNIKAVAIIDDYGKCARVVGVLQNIELQKLRELGLKSTLLLVNNRNKRLQDFAHIVSHNLRSHAGNLQALLNLFDEADLQEDRDQIFAQLNNIGGSLNQTINHVNEIVQVEFVAGQQRTQVEFEPVFTNVFNALHNELKATAASIEHDFSECPSVYYPAAYLESVLYNLLSNAVKYRHPNRAPVIKCRSWQKAGNIYLSVEDNGLGIDLTKYGEKMFGMYQTFHSHPEAQGIGLFITRNQIEAMGGFITVESQVNIGTKFTIHLV